MRPKHLLDGNRHEVGGGSNVQNTTEEPETLNQMSLSPS